MPLAAAVPPYTAEWCERGYNNRAAVPEFQRWFDHWAALSRDVVARHRPRVDVRYGRGARETLDLFLPAGRPRGTLVFIHGGYWRSLDKADHAFVAPPFVAQGIAVANLNYELCPSVSIADIVAQAQRAIAFLQREGSRLGLPSAPLVVAGHSAGGHLAAMLLATPSDAFGTPAHPVRGGVSLSGVHDLEPLLLTSYNADLRLDAAQARAMSPVHLQPQCDAPLLLAVGTGETSEFLRQTDLLWDAWPAARPRGMEGPLRVPGRHHFDVVVDYADPASALTRATLDLF
ncbi:MAG TPA: alpha/beta hydrolase [Casimicrobiaceae bacterium]|nr:alpha/beta hydrolase [Casimicrobiaceae bacterium]